MKFVSLRSAGRIVPGIVAGEEIVDLSDRFPDLVSLIEGGPEALDVARGAMESRTVSRIALEGAELVAPITRFRRDVLCTGWNYWDHFEEGRAERPTQDRPKAPTFFNKSPDTVVGPYDPVAIDPSFSETWDYEAELALVFGRTARSIPAGEAFAHVFGYCLANDVSQRDLQRRHGGQWNKGKSIDGTMPLGPMLVTADEIDPQALRLQCILNGETMQDATTAQMAFSIPELIAELSFGMTVRAGDVVLTGTPSGVGQSRKPPVFLRDGDVMVTRGEGIGEMRNLVRQVDLRGRSDVDLAA
ncbi:2-keto-4-pentenoate hydratase/2-oxohepta-3-ene-1,7-dioic acid hydratase (catechol pathway) [Faunimonas pinastri]|uniref:2-keto-4-pentenoate hydratase/2-oxohepta-3-ene-1,7-dioic acid hydratase (Catechol pathway) n=1 Tax=Faunimonas pinastri TaxID=1855383 RepID=A0A1H9E4A7_9HYPH|nr:fumarylacetoacetate hydrolase family protein [Faunimonas pinastri]SEQ20564.1 2-keto-4-pentenoate hydratase/2-oxohepta-3-ene-1,7-dioic acid hydratase (catechol pathway) [Faunimonas pinastri]